MIIDPQNDFCSPKGSLYVPNAEKDCATLAEFITKNIDAIDAIHLTLDTHPFYHIAHPSFWKTQSGEQPDLYTQITYEDFDNGLFLPVDENQHERVGKYLSALQSRNRYKLTIWPPHCLMATWGACIVPEIWNAVHSWECKKSKRTIDYVLKTMNPFTEHYSAIQAEVPDPSDPATRTNFTLIDQLKNKNVIIAGEALSHCVSNTIRDICVYVSPSQVTLLSDCTSNVKGFEQVGEDFLTEYKSKGMKFLHSNDLVI